MAVVQPHQITPHPFCLPQKKTGFGLSLLALALAGCSSTMALDPVIGDTGQPLSQLAQKADVKRYALDLEIFPDEQKIAGVGETEFVLVAPSDKVELKLDSRFDISKIEVNGKTAQYQRQGGVLTIALGAEQPSGATAKVAVYYSGKPHVAKNAPWAGGSVWSKTAKGEHFIATAVQGEGCDLFWPCKDHFSDKADRMQIKLTVPKGLSAVTNGVLQKIDELPGNKQRFDWLLSVPASDYNIALNIGPYSRISETYQSINGATVPIEFWALSDNADKAKTLIKDDVRAQLAFYERRLGPYPWGDQKMGVVETPHLGMEHQTVNAYGKGYKRDEYGFDWLLHHELAHEWFGNLMTHEKLNDAWLHEGFGLYMQPAYALEKLGSAAYSYQMYKSYLGLLNCEPVVRSGVVTSDQAFNPDIYGKGGWVLHSLRNLIGEEAFWQATRELLYGTADTAKLQYPIKPRYRNTKEFISIVNRITGQDYQWLFDVYLYEAALPELKQQQNGDAVTFSWLSPNKKPFPMPVEISINGQTQLLDFSKGAVTVALKSTDQLLIDPQMKVLRQLPLIGLCEENRAKVKNKRAE
ncbi:M1 family metallopeptidase [Rheinheimera sp. 4Y26]|uniref:M1 family metallopeptidase n=1 Tax=Rheinheimera sp. 4Y26 TaxID=2977811 RepID=UPI0021B13CBF|nr:M1 family metallopeptidase [Rheinheimera sp. 4Y26]MCT6698402.1 M1 family metallopeptidase [Rheinheimera sp. 4Y26]